MRKPLFVLFLTAIILSLIAIGQITPARAQSVWCQQEYPPDNRSWQALVGSAWDAWDPPGISAFRSVLLTGTNTTNIRLYRNFYRNNLYSIDVSIYFFSITEIPPHIQFIPLLGGIPQGTFESDLDMQAGAIRQYRFNFGYIDSDSVQIDLIQSSITDTPNYMFMRVDRICSGNPWYEPTNTPIPVTPSATVTAQATLVNTSTPIPTITRTPSLTRTPRAATATRTPTPDVGTPSATPDDGYDRTPLPPLEGGDYNTPTLPSPGLRWVFPVPGFPTPALSIPTLIAVRSTSTLPAAPSEGTYTAGDGGSFLRINLGDSLTRVGMYSAGIISWQTQVFIDANGTPMADLRNQANVIANNIGGFFYVLRSVRDATGQIGDLVVILLILIAFNIVVRFVVTGISIALFAWRAIKSLIDLIAKTPALLITLVIVVIIIVILIVSGAASESEWSQSTLTLTTPVVTSTGSVTPTHTLIPLTPTNTPRFRGFRVTPTEISINTTPIFDVSEALPDISGNTADQVINAYKAINTGTRGGVDLLAFMALASITIGMAVRLVSRLNKDK